MIFFVSLRTINTDPKFILLFRMGATVCAETPTARFLPLYDREENGNFSGKYLQLFIAHNRGCRYYVGHMDGESFVPELHGRMSWNDKMYFAPEALIDNKKRHIIWVWLFEKNQVKNMARFGYNGVFSFPKNVWFEDGELHMAPIKELENSEYEKQVPNVSASLNGNVIDLPKWNCFRIQATFELNSEKCGFDIAENPEDGSKIEIYYNTNTQKLVFDSRSLGEYDSKIKEEAPLCMKKGEKLELDIIFDKSVAEVYANKKQSICRRVFFDAPEKANVIRLIGSGLVKMEYSKIFPTFEI